MHNIWQFHRNLRKCKILKLVTWLCPLPFQGRLVISRDMLQLTYPPNSDTSDSGRRECGGHQFLCLPWKSNGQEGKKGPRNLPPQHDSAWWTYMEIVSQTRHKGPAKQKLHPLSLVVWARNLATTKELCRRLDSFNYWCLRKILHTPYKKYVTNAGVRRVTLCQPVSDMLRNNIQKSHVCECDIQICCPEV